MFPTLLASIGGLLAEGGADPGVFGGSFIPFMVVIMVLFWLMVIRPQRSKEREFKALLENLKKNDRVVTVGGIHGVVTNVQREADRVTLRVDEATGTTLRVGLSSIARVVGDESETTGKPAAKQADQKA